MNRLPLVVVLVGSAITALVTVAAGLPGDDAVALLLLAAGGAVAGAGLGGLLLRSMRRSSLHVQAVAIALISVVGTGVGVILAANAMFVSSHDLTALSVVALASGTVAIAMAAWFGGRIGMASRDLEDLARRLGDGDVLTVGDVPAAVELRRLGEQLADASARLDDARTKERSMERARRQLVAWVSHDLRTPLSAVRAMLEAIDDGVVEDPDVVASYHGQMSHELARLTRLVDDLFELSRIESGAVELRLESMPLADIVADAVASTMAVAQAKGVAISDNGVRSDPRALVSAPEFSRVLQNLLENAIRYTPEGGSVAIECRAEADETIVSVSDTCGGIAEHDLARVFDFAYRGDVARSRADHDGGGLGLAIAHGLVEAHEGRISVENADGGCRFTVRLPGVGGISAEVTER